MTVPYSPETDEPDHTQDVPEDYAWDDDGTDGTED